LVPIRTMEQLRQAGVPTISDIAAPTASYVVLGEASDGRLVILDFPNGSGGTVKVSHRDMEMWCVEPLISTWDELLGSALPIRVGNMETDTRYALISRASNGGLEHGTPSSVWFFSDVYSQPRELLDRTVPFTQILFARGEPVVWAVVGRPICTVNRPQRYSAVDFGLIDPSPTSRRRAKWLCVNYAMRDRLLLPSNAVAA
jgi:hypothetical protein